MGSEATPFKMIAVFGFDLTTLDQSAKTAAHPTARWSPLFQKKISVISERYANHEFPP
jgi:hypothetical protein